MASWTRWLKNGAPLPVVTVSVELPVAGFVENEPLMPDVKPEAESVTGPENPFDGVIVMRGRDGRSEEAAV